MSHKQQRSRVVSRRRALASALLFIVMANLPQASWAQTTIDYQSPVMTLNQTGAVTDRTVTPTTAGSLAVAPLGAVPNGSKEKDEIVVRGRLPKPRKVAVKDFDAVIHLRKVKRDGARIEAISLALSAVDGIITSHCLALGTCRELNPLLGRTPSPLRIFALKGAIGGAQWHDRDKLSDRDPYAARSHAYLELAQNIVIAASTAITGL